MNSTFALSPCSSSCQEAASTPNLGKWGPTPKSCLQGIFPGDNGRLTHHRLSSCRKYWKIRTRYIFFFFQSTSSHRKITRALQTKEPRSQKECMIWERSLSHFFPWVCQFLSNIWKVEQFLGIYGAGVTKKREFRVPQEGRARLKTSDLQLRLLEKAQSRKIPACRKFESSFKSSVLDWISAM